MGKKPFFTLLASDAAAEEDEEAPLVAVDVGMVANGSQPEAAPELAEDGV